MWPPPGGLVALFLAASLAGVLMLAGAELTIDRFVPNRQDSQERQRAAGQLAARLSRLFSSAAIAHSHTICAASPQGDTADPRHSNPRTKTAAQAEA